MFCEGCGEDDTWITRWIATDVVIIAAFSELLELIFSRYAIPPASEVLSGATCEPGGAK